MPRDDLAGKNLDDIGLSGSNLEQSDLSKTSMRRSNLRQANLRGANLAGSDLRDAHLQDADFTGADLSDANLTGANLEGVDLTQAATTEGIILTGAGAEVGTAPHGDDHRASVGDVKIAVLERLDTERADWDTLIGSIPVAWLDLPQAFGDWSVKDVIAHISGWQQPSVDEFIAVVQGTPLPALGWPHTFQATDAGTPEAEAMTQAVNDWIHAHNAERSHDQVLAEADLQWTMLRAVVTAMPDRLLEQPGAFARLGRRSLAEIVLSGAYFAHYHDEHEAGIRAWLTRMHGRPASG